MSTLEEVIKAVREEEVKREEPKYTKCREERKPTVELVRPRMTLCRIPIRAEERKR